MSTTSDYGDGSDRRDLDNDGPPGGVATASRAERRDAQGTGATKVISIISIISGIVLVLGGILTWVTVANTLADEKITTSPDACLAGRTVADPFTAYCEAEVISKHALEATGGKTYAELGRDDPLRDTAMTASFLRASLFTSVVAFGLSALVVGLGILFILIGVALRQLASAVTVVIPRL